jgi:hypothetical protein
MIFRARIAAVRGINGRGAPFTVCIIPSEIPHEEIAVNKILACLAVSALALPAAAADSIARFEGGIGSQPLRASAPGVPAVNDVNGVNPGGRPWLIASLSADVKSDGRISVVGRGLILGGGAAIGTPGGQSVRARLFCGGVPHDSPTLTPLEADGDFRIEENLASVPPNPCVNPVLLIINAGGSWFAAGIPKL